MKVRPQRHESFHKIAELVADFDTCMLTTMAADGKLISRPMAPLEICSDGNFWFFTNESSTKTHQLESVNLSFTDEYNSVYVSVSGYGDIVRDRRLVDSLWTPAARTWFPDGKDDPDLALLMVTLEMAEYWDAHSSKMIHPLALLTSAVTGRPLNAGEHEIVHNPHLIDLRQRSLMDE
jgi:general stress protein 26